MTLVSYRSEFDCPPEALFAFHLDATNLPRISPPLPKLRLLSEAKTTEEGDRQSLALCVGPLTREWDALVTHVIAPRLIEDVQERGPFLRWRHQHRVSGTARGSALTDVIAFRALPTPVGEFVEWLAVRPAMGLMLRYRHWRTRALLRSGDAPR
ncbi:hypothetical protein AYO38_06615 [bacterium SCGC AG-212-C10]|nr:hypothetical protein AYO38_06615 [bacterium SCGC AG-212-C10]